MLWILPLTSMHEQYRQRFHKHGLSFETWTFSSHPSNAAKNILVIMEQGAEPKLREFVDQLLTSKRVVRVVLDEAHLALTHDSFRTIMGLLKWLGQAGVQILLMSATVPPSLEQAVFHKLGIADYVVCRERTDRRNISYNVLIAKDIHLALGRVCGEIMKAPPTHQALIFCRSREICEAVAKQLDLPAIAACPAKRLIQPYSSCANGKLVQSSAQACLAYPSTLTTYIIQFTSTIPTMSCRSFKSQVVAVVNQTLSRIPGSSSRRPTVTLESKTLIYLVQNSSSSGQTISFVAADPHSTISMMASRRNAQ